MEKKSNIRSMRFSDRTIELIEQQAGDNFTQKFEALVTRCVWELPEKEKELERVQRHINDERERLHQIQVNITKYNNALRNIEYYLTQTESSVKKLIESL